MFGTSGEQIEGQHTGAAECTRQRVTLVGKKAELDLEGFLDPVLGGREARRAKSGKRK